MENSDVGLQPIEVNTEREVREALRALSPFTVGTSLQTLFLEGTTLFQYRRLQETATSKSQSIKTAVFVDQLNY